MRKAKEELINKISLLYKYLVKNQEIKLFSYEREKLNFLKGLINDNAKVNDEIDITTPFQQIPSDKLLVSRDIDEITSHLKNNRNEIMLSSSEKVNVKKFLQLIDERTMIKEEEAKKIDEINKKMNHWNLMESELHKRIEAANEQPDPDKNQIEVLLKCINFIELRIKLKKNPTASLQNDWNKLLMDDNIDKVLPILIEIEKYIQ